MSADRYLPACLERFAPIWLQLTTARHRNIGACSARPVGARRWSRVHASWDGNNPSTARKAAYFAERSPVRSPGRVPHVEKDRRAEHAVADRLAGQACRVKRKAIRGQRSRSRLSADASRARGPPTESQPYASLVRALICSLLLFGSQDDRWYRLRFACVRSDRLLSAARTTWIAVHGSLGESRWHRVVDAARRRSSHTRSRGSTPFIVRSETGVTRVTVTASWPVSAAARAYFRGRVKSTAVELGQHRGAFGVVEPLGGVGRSRPVLRGRLGLMSPRDRRATTPSSTRQIRDDRGRSSAHRHRH